MGKWWDGVKKIEVPLPLEDNEIYMFHVLKKTDGKFIIEIYYRKLKPNKA